MPHATNNGFRIHYEVEGEAAGEPLVIHPGFFGALEDWRDAEFVPALRDRYRLILLDPRGQGRSDAPHDLQDYAVPHRVGDVLAVMDAAGADRAHVWGYSMGASVGLALGKSAPRRLRSLILGGASPFHLPHDPETPDGLLADLRSGMPALVQAWETAIPGIWTSAGERERWLALDAEALIAARIQRLAEAYIEKADLPGIETRTLLYAGSADSPEARALLDLAARLMPHAETVLLPGLDHAAAGDRSDLVLPHVLPFLERVG
jgi:pimeloyl-ACP methyl ester carboxylesterase